MILSKELNIKKRSRNKLTKKQLKELRSHKFFLYERSWETTLTRLKITKAYCLVNRELHKHSLDRINKLFDKAKEAFANELEAMGAYERKEGYVFNLSPKQRKIKISVEAK